MALRFAEEIVLLLLNDEDGRFAQAPAWSLNCAMAGGVLMDLALENRIDSDLEKLVIIDPTPVGDSLLDDTLSDIVAGGLRDARYWVERVANRGLAIRQEALSRLVERGVLESRDDRFLWVFRSRRYPAIDGEPEREVKTRIMDVLFSNEIPGPRDVVIISLAHACDIFSQLLSRSDMERAHERIEQVRKLDLIGQAMTQAIHAIERSISSSVHPGMYWVGADRGPVTRDYFGP